MNFKLLLKAIWEALLIPVLGIVITLTLIVGIIYYAEYIIIPFFTLVGIGYAITAVINKYRDYLK